MSMKNYFIKDGYQINEKAKTFETEFVGEYWTKERIKTSSDYQYEVYLYTKELFIKNNFKSIMDLGCGPATKAKDLLVPVCDDLTFVDQPNTENIINQTVPTGKFYGVDLETINLEINKKFDIIICADVIEHIYKPEATLEFIKKHLSNNGYLIISTPERDVLRGKECLISPHPAHIREWNESEFKKMLTHFGFKVEQQLLMPAKKLSSIELFKRRMLGFFIKKPDWFSCQTAICTYKP